MKSAKVKVANCVSVKAPTSAAPPQKKWWPLSSKTSTACCFFWWYVWGHYIDPGVPPRSLTANAPEKWWLEDYFPVGRAYFQGRIVKRRGGYMLECSLGISNSDHEDDITVFSFGDPVFFNPFTFHCSFEEHPKAYMCNLLEISPKKHPDMLVFLFTISGGKGNSFHPLSTISSVPKLPINKKNTPFSLLSFFWVRDLLVDGMARSSWSSSQKWVSWVISPSVMERKMVFFNGSEQLGGKVRPILGRFDQTNTLSEINT